MFVLGSDIIATGRSASQAGDLPDLGKKFPGDQQFIVGKDQTDKNWLCVQPGPKADWAGSHPHTIEVLFNIESVPPEGDLVITTLDADAGPDPLIQVTCNGQPVGEIKRPAGLDMKNVRAKPNANSNRPYRSLITIPGKFLKAGENRLSLTLTEGNWIAYSGIQLIGRTSPAPPTRLINATANPAQVDRSSQELAQYVVLDLQNNGGRRKVPITVDGRDVSAEIPTGRHTLVIKVPTNDKGRVIPISVDGEKSDLALAPVTASPQPEAPKPPIGPEPLGNIPTNAVVLHDGWRLQSSVLAGEDGAMISKDGFDDSSWFTTSVPTTVLNALVRNGVYPDPYDGMNNLLIPDAHPEYSRRQNLDRFSHLPDGSNPWLKPWWFRDTFTLPPAKTGETVWLNLDGVNYRADIWLNGTKIADATNAVGMFKRFRYPVTHLIQNGTPNVLAVAIHPLDHPGDPRSERQNGAMKNVGAGGNGGDGTIGKDVTHSFVVNWDWNAPTRDRNMGLWQHVWLETTGPVAIRNPALESEINFPSATEAKLTLRCRIDNPASSPQEVPLTIEIKPENFARKGIAAKTTLKVPPGADQEIVLTPKEIPELILKNPHLWWPKNYGEQSLYRVTVTAGDSTGKVSSTATALAGIRKAGSFVLPSGGRAFSINDRTIRMTGGHFVPDSSMNWDAQRYRDEVRLMAEGNDSIVRINGCGIIPPDVFFDACDREGLLVWLDLARTSAATASPDTAVYVANMDDSIVRSRSHPSLLLYCGCNEVPPEGDGPRVVALELIPKLDPKTPYLSNSGIKKTPWAREGNNCYSGGPYDASPLDQYFKNYREDRAFTCKDEMGLTSLPPMNSVVRFIPNPEQKPGEKLLTDSMGYHDAFRSDAWSTQSPRGGGLNFYGSFPSLNDYLWAGQVMSAQHYRGIFDAANAARPRNEGTHIWKINAAWGSWNWQLYDWYLRPNAGYWFMKAACRPLNCAYSLPDRGLQIVSTLDKSFAGTLKARLLDPSLKEVWHEEIPVNAPADTTTTVGTVPEAMSSGPLHWLRLDLLDATGKSIAQSTYWQSGTSGWQGEGLRDLPIVDVSAKVIGKKSLGVEDELRIAVTASSTNTAPAFLCQLEVTDGPLGMEVLPSFWDDNALVLLPGETRELTVRYRRSLLSKDPHLMVEGWNVHPRCIDVADNKEVKLEATLSGPQPAGEGKASFTLTPSVASTRYITWPTALEWNGRKSTVRFATHGQTPSTVTLDAK